MLVSAPRMDPHHTPPSPDARTASVIDPNAVAEEFRREVREELAALPEPLFLVGVLAADHGPSYTYAEYTRKACEDVGVRFEIRHATRLSAEAAIRSANADPGVHGIMVYYPIFGTEQDVYLRDSVDPSKDIEGLHTFWARCLYGNQRFLDEARTKKAILPCTPLAILKLVEAAGFFGEGERPLAGRSVCIFNRSEVVGRPLASMMAHDGAHVTSFDIDGPLLFVPSPSGDTHEVHETTVDRASALRQADIVVTGVPSRSFPHVQASEIREGALCINFSTFKNFSDDIQSKAKVFVPRVGPMTVTMAIRNSLRLYKNAHQG
ncbi:bifunctional methylenetetrahydrofolate dehydrogenase/methenyltetrahydrofolate cyclohydrolase [Sorangium sp. So ce291]|uniref:bifunctional methylenetetrahydrofolate dehydrogenase/methenyltetrahydrofolate cyclohydrolase n=1 Tax=Sorangium sp. So ce291 TaxID=3133294 RepID=UPI003F621197